MNRIYSFQSSSFFSEADKNSTQQPASREVCLPFDDVD